MKNRNAYNIEICYHDGSRTQSSGLGLLSCITKAGEYAINNDEIVQVNIRDIHGDWPIIASLVMHDNEE